MTSTRGGVAFFIAGCTIAGRSSSLAETSTSKGQGDFFAVDRRAWARACSLGINTAVTYLMLARGTSADNRTSTWSVQAIEKYTSVSRGRAQAAIHAGVPRRR